MAPLSGYYSQSSSTITLSPVEASYHDLTFSLSHIQPTITLTETPVFIRGGEPLGILTSEPPPQNIEGEHYIHLQLHKRVGNETYALDPTQFLQPIVRPSVALEYHCNDLITYVGGSVVDRRSLVPQTHQEVEYGEPLVDDAIPAHEFPRPVDHVLKAQGTILSGASVELLSSSTFIMVGPIPMQFGEPIFRPFSTLSSVLVLVQISELSVTTNWTILWNSLCCPARQLSPSLHRWPLEPRGL